VPLRAFGASAGIAVFEFSSTLASAGTAAEREIEAFAASEAFVVYLGTEASEMGKREAGLEARSVLAHLVENSIEANAAVGKLES
jgi:hypothetical protein